MSQSTILIVDDEPNVRFLFRTALESEGYEIVGAADGLEALEKIEESPFELVLLDLQMPNLGGMATLRRLREGGHDVPVVAVTAHGTVADAVQAMKLGAVDFLSKPVTPAELRHVVAEVIARHADVVPPAPARSVRPTVAVGPAVVELTRAKRALNLRRFGEAESLLQAALDVDPLSVEANNLMGVLHESLGEHHAAYRFYKSALDIDPQYDPALDNLRRYCEQHGLDFTNKLINPAAHVTRGGGSWRLRR
jgi:DNA-binding response OmpR family regulator